MVTETLARVYAKQGNLPKAIEAYKQILRQDPQMRAAFFEKHGTKALVIGRFVPIVRTFITLVAGVSAMNRRTFFVWSAGGAVLWVLSITLAGYFLGAAFPAIGKNLEIAVIAIIGVSLLPMVFEWWRHRRAAASAD